MRTQTFPRLKAGLSVCGLIALASLCPAAQATAITTIVAAYGTCSDPSNAGCVALSSYLTGPSAGQTIHTISFANAANGGFTSGIATYTGNVGVDQGSQPAGESSSTTYIGEGQYSTNPSFQPQYQQFSTTITFSQALTYFGLYWGSPSSYDTLAIYSAGSEIYSYSGSNLSSTASYVSFDAAAGTTFNEIVLTSAQCCFENNNQSYVTAQITATPEPGTLTTAGTLAAILPFYLYRRRRGSVWVFSRAARCS